MGETGSAVVEVLFSASEIAERNRALAAEITQSVPHDLLVVAILKGSFIFAADLLRALSAAGAAPEVDFLALSSYGARLSSAGTVTIVRDLETDVAGRNVLIIDDILESGRTLAFAKALIAERGAASVRTCVLLDKPVARAADVTADFCAFPCPNVFVVGYGMDAAHRYRELPFVGRLRPE